jgi:hypothetical protein
VQSHSQSGHENCQDHDDNVEDKVQPLLNHNQEVGWALAGIDKLDVLLDLLWYECCIADVSIASQ